mmetsp:Transcript_65772/g.140721  ORF Transcript_65772/g.140721 Transcript_65772/m.140721 type:complete len:241 (+) Transcript_65772:150-872(+)
MPFPCAPCQLCCRRTHEVGHGGVIENAARPADGDLAGAAIATYTLLRLVVNAAVLLLMIEALHAEEAAFAPLVAPRVADQPVLVLPLLSEAESCDRMVHDAIPGASVVDTLIVVVQTFRHDRHGYGALLNERLHEWLFLVHRQRLEAHEAEDSARMCDVHTTVAFRLHLKIALRARSGLGQVRHGMLIAEAMFRGPVQTDLHRCAIATALATAMVRVGRARQELLHREVARRAAPVDLVV